MTTDFSKTSFSKDSDVTVVLTSCGRFDLLKTTIETFLQFNSYPVRKFIITEDSGKEEVYNVIPKGLESYFSVIINQPALGQTKSIDLAYSMVDTEYIFHCEDDWEFYRSGFIEDSLNILKSNSQILQVWLRDFYHDIKVHCSFHYLGSRKTEENAVFYKVESTKSDWQGFSFNPGLRRLKDYQLVESYQKFESEKALSKKYAELGFYAVILENSAVAHTGWGKHVEDVREKKKKRSKKKKHQWITIGVGIVAFLIGYLAANL